jgi:hypothetical protein
LISDFVVEVVVELLFQDTNVGGFFRAEECGELVAGNLVVVVGGSNLLGEGIVVGGILEVLAERSYEDISAILTEDISECVSAVDQTIGSPELDAAFVATHDVYIVSQST